MSHKRESSKIPVGRLNDKKRMVMIEEIRQQYDNGVQGIIAARTLRINENTVIKYYKEWAKTEFERQNESFFDTQQKAKEKAIHALETRLSDIITKTAIIQNRYANSEEFTNEDLVLYREFSKEIKDLILQKSAIEMTPTSKYLIDEEIKRYVGTKLTQDNS